MNVPRPEPAIVTCPAGEWRFIPADRARIDAKSRANRLGFAVMLLFFRERGRFPRGAGKLMPRWSPAWLA